MLNFSTPSPDFNEELELLDATLSGEPVPGIPGLLVGAVRPRPYPINIYNLDNQKESGIAGTLYPDGSFVALPTANVPRGVRAWNHELKIFEDYEVVWDGVVSGSVEVSVDPEQPHTRKFDSQLIGPWPNHPPKAERVVNPEKARLAALENEMNGGLV